MGSQASYLRLFEGGTLAARAEAARSRLAACDLCPRRCGVDRRNGERGECATGAEALVSSIFPHHGEERCLSGWNGSGTIFFAGCNLGCVFCQNWDLSHEARGSTTSPEMLARGMIRLQEMGCHNINLVTPTHTVAQFLEALPIAIEKGLHLPVVYNSSGYDSEDTLTLLAGVVDIYMPDLKYLDRDQAERFLRARDYPATAQRALMAMHRQVGDLRFDDDGLAVRGLLVRHLLMPGNLENTRNVLRFLAEEISRETVVNIMGQYHLSGDACEFPELCGRVSRQDVEEAMEFARTVGLYRFQ